jgi:hypothetical protein
MEFFQKTIKKRRKEIVFYFVSRTLVSCSILRQIVVKSFQSASHPLGGGGIGDLMARPALPLGHLFDLSDLAMFCQSMGESLAQDFFFKK